MRILFPWRSNSTRGICLIALLAAITLAVAPPAQAQSPAKSTSEAATGESAQALLDLTKLARLSVDRVFEESPVNLMYQAKSTVVAGDDFYGSALKKEGWKPADGKPYVTDQYAYRLFQKDGYYLRASVAQSDKLVMVTLQHLGNVDVRELPRIGNAPAAAESTPANVTYATPTSMADALKFCREQMAARGWKEVVEAANEIPDVPHVKMARFRKNDVRVDALIHRDPMKLAEGPTSVSWLTMTLVEPKRKLPLEALAESRTKKNRTQPEAEPQAEAEDPPAKPVPKGVPKDDDDDDDLAAKIQREVKAKLERELKKLGKDLGDLGDLGLDDLDKPAKPKSKTGKDGGKNTAKPTTKPSDSENEPRSTPPKKAPVVYYEAGPCRGYVSKSDKKVELKHAVAVSYKNGDDAVTAIYCSDKPLKLAKFKKGNPDNLSLFELTGFESSASLGITLRESSTSYNLSIGGASISTSSTSLKFDIAEKNGRLTGKATLPEPEKFFDDKLQFEVTLDLPRDQTELPPTPNLEPGELADSEEFDLPLPNDRSSTESSKTPYRQTLAARFPATLDQAVKFYRKQMALKKFAEDAKAAKIGKQSAELLFTNSEGPVRVSLKTADDDVTVELVKRNEAAARKDGIVPTAGMAKLMIANTTELAATITVAGKTYSLKAGEGSENPKSATKIDIKPGKVTLTIKVGRKPARTETIEVPADVSMGYLLGEDSDFFDVFY